MNINKILEYHHEKHKLTHILTTHGENILQNLRYDYDGFSNLASRKDEERDMEETFTYDHLNRLTGIWRNSFRTGWMDYDEYGRMTRKVIDNALVFTNAVYDEPPKPHAIDRADTDPQVFSEQNVTYTNFDKVKHIEQNGNTVDYTYGYDRQRIFMEEHVGNTTRTKRYIGNCELLTVTTDEGTTSEWHTFLTAPTGVYAVVVSDLDKHTLHYVLKDNLGSWTTITDSEGHVEQEVSFDAWGNLRDTETWLNYPTDEPAMALMFDRGFTGHEHMTRFGLINMNGRCYDPLTSSFLSVDAYVQDPTNAQSFNRYAYCSHNPLRYTDPTGWYQQTGSGYNINPKANLIGTTTYQSDDPCDMLWGRSVHPCKDGDPDGTIITSSGFMIGNSFVTSCNGPLGQLQAIMNYINSPGEYTAMILQAMNIDMTAGFTCGSYQGMEGFRLSNYSWTDASGQSYHADVLEYIGGDFNGHYITGNEPAARFRNENYNGVPNAFDYGISYAGVVTSFIKDKWENPGSRAQKAINQKKAYNTQKALKAKGITKSVKQIKAGKITSLKTGGNILGAVGVGISVYDAMTTDVIRPSNIYELTTSLTCFALCFCTGPVGWIAGAVFLGAEVFSYAYNGMSVGDNLNRKIDWSYNKHQ